MCICKRALPIGSKEYSYVELWKQKSANKKDEDMFIQMSANIQRMKIDFKNLFPELEKLKTLKKEYTDEKRNIIEELDEVSLKLDNKNFENIRELESKKKRIDRKISDLDNCIGEGNYIIDCLKQEKSNLKQKLDAIIAVEGKSKIAQKRYKLAEESAKALKIILEITNSNVRKKLQNRINEVYEHFSRKGYKAILNNNFELKVVKEYDGRIVPMSDGEAQITSLCFIGALVDVAREKSENENAQFIKGGIFPIVMDSPFGELDENHKIRITKGMPKLSQQVIIMVRNDQWEGSVEERYSQTVIQTQ